MSFMMASKQLIKTYFLRNCNSSAAKHHWLASISSPTKLRNLPDFDSSCVRHIQGKPICQLTCVPVRLLHFSRNICKVNAETACSPSPSTKVNISLNKLSTDSAGSRISLLSNGGSSGSKCLSTSPILKDLSEIEGKSSSKAQVSYTESLKFFSLRSLISTPFPFMLYGLGGVIPFAAAPIYMQWTGLYNPSVGYAQLVYGACILSFLGGVAWGNDLNSTKVSLTSLRYGIVLPLVAWASVLFHPNPGSFLALMLGVAYAGCVDVMQKDYPRWFKNLRFLLSSLVVGCLLSTFVFRFSKDPASSDGNGDNKGSEKKSD